MIKEINHVLNNAVDNHLIPGASYCICNSKGIIHCDDIGYKALFPEKIIHSKDVIYDIASLTKVISTTTLIMKLIEDGKLSLNSKVKDILPRFKHQNITVYDCLTHTSGLPADLKNASKLKDENEVLDKIYELDLIYMTGKHIVYSDVGFILLGKIIEQLTHEKLIDFAQKIIFEPLKMNQTTYRPNKDLCAPTEYRNDDVYQGFLKGDVHDEKSFAMNGNSGHAGLFSTAKDIAIFMISILSNQSVISKNTIDELFKVRLETDNLQGVQLKRALGWDKPTANSSAGEFVDFDQTILHTGFTGCNMFIDRKNDIGFVLLSNDVHPTRDSKGIIGLRPLISNLVVKGKDVFK